MKDVNELKNLQKVIIEKNKKINKISIIITLIVLICFLTYVYVYGQLEPNGFLGIVISVVSFSFIITAATKGTVNGKNIALFNQNFKELFVLKALKDNFDDVKFTPERGFDESFINKIGMLDTADRYHSNDLFSAKYNGIDFQQADIHTEDRYEDKDGHVSYVTRFKGRYMIFEFNKKFKANIRVTSKDFSSASLPWRKKFHEVKMEDVEFNKRFKVYAENEHDAFYILTPHFMEKLKELDNKFDAGLLFGFVDNKLHIAVDNYEDSFEHNVLEEINEASIENEIIKDIKFITDFVKELNLENDLFGKEV